MKNIIKVLSAVMLTVSLVSCGTTEESVASTGAYTVGTYTGVSENGKGGEVKVEVTFSDSAITDIEVTEHNETAGISDPAIETVPQEIIEAQSLAVDTVTGATITSNAILEAVEDAVNQAGGDVTALKQTTANTQEKNTEEKSATVVIVGAGAAGMAAATAAYEAGAESVIVVEKNGTIGGNAIVSGGFIENTKEELRPESNDGYDAYVEEFFAQGPQNESEEVYWDTLEEQYEEYKASGSTKIFDSIEFFGVDTARIYGLEECGPQVQFAQLCQDFCDWLEEEAGATWNNPTAGIVGFNWPRWASLEGYYSGTGYFEYLQNWINENNANIEILTSTPMTDLIEEDGAITGIIAESNDTIYEIHAEKGVILCTGGYAANIEMVEETDGIWGNLPEDLLSTNASGATGEGITIAQQHGASVGGMEDTMLFPLGSIKTANTEAIVGNSASMCLVNREGNRFVDETLDRYTMSGAILAQTDQIAFGVCTEANSKIVDGKTQGGVDVQGLLDSGELYKADTLEEVAELAGIDSEQLLKTIEEYNAAVDSYSDSLTGRTSFEPGSKIEEGPYYIFPCKPAAHITNGGLNTSEYGEVVNDDGEVIQGLWAAGEVTNGNSGIDGSFSLGRYVGQNIMK